jgi:hypothetical protein
VLIGSAGADPPSLLDFDDSTHHILLHPVVLDGHSLRLEQLLQKLPIILLHLLNQVVDVGAVTTVQSAELFIEEVKFISLLERCIEHVHCHMKVECLVNLLILLIITR